MKLSKLIIDKLLGDLDLRLDLAKHLRCGEQAIIRNCERNGKDNKLTTFSAISFLVEKTGFVESELLTKESIATA